ncbi:MAG: response regulator [Nitrospirae bacterium]|nr:response regulator [Nitrospirota bacterium]
MRVSSQRRYSLDAEPQPAESEQTPYRQLIIVIDQDEDIRLMLCDRLRGLGFEAEGKMEQTPPTGLLVELDMPVLGGMAIIQELTDLYPRLPIIAMSHSAHIDRLRAAIQLGAKEYLVKPFDPELFRRKCIQVFQRGNGTG